MYTEEGNWDIVGNNIPVFFIQDSIKFPDFVHAVKPEPHNEVPQAQSAHNNFWDFVGLQPEASHMVMWGEYSSFVLCTRRKKSESYSHVRPRYSKIISHDARLRSEHFHPHQCSWEENICQVPFCSVRTLFTCHLSPAYSRASISELGVHSLVWDEALKIAGQDPGSYSILIHDFKY